MTESPGPDEAFVGFAGSSGGGTGADRHDVEPPAEANAPDAIAAFAALLRPFFSFFALRASYVSCMDWTKASSVTVAAPRAFLAKISWMSSRLIFAFERKSAASAVETCPTFAPGRVP